MKTVTIDRSKRWTVDDYLLLGEMNTICELIDGEIVMSPSPLVRHQHVLTKLAAIFYNYAKSVGGRTFVSPLDVYIDNSNVLQPDIIFLSAPSKKHIAEKGIKGPPDLVVEIISPSSSIYDRGKKKNKYLQFGIAEVWVIDPGNETLEVYRQGQRPEEHPAVHLVGEGLITSAVLPGFSLEFKTLFED